MADTGEWKGASWKQEEDFSKETDEMLEQINAELLPVLLRSTDKDVDAFAAEVMVLEKKTRLAGDTLSTTRLAVEIVKMYRTQKLYSQMLEKLEFLMKRRGQMKQVQSAMIAECAKALDELPGGKKKSKTAGGDDDDNDNATASAAATATNSSEDRTKILTQLVHVTAGKIHVELEHARFTVELAHIIESQGGSKKEAATMLSDLQVETITQMPRLEKIEIILDQLRLNLEMNELVRVPSVSRKISYRALGKADCRELKIRYFRLMGDYFRRLNQHFMMARCEHEIYLTAMGTAEEVETSETGADELQSKAPTAVQRKNTHLVKTSSSSPAASPKPSTSSSSATNKKNNSGGKSSTTNNKFSSPTSDLIISPEMERLALESITKCAILVLVSEHLTPKEVEDQAECCAFSPQTSVHTDRSKWLIELEKNKNLSREAATIHSIVKAFNSDDLIREDITPSIAELSKNNAFLAGDSTCQRELQMRLSEHDILVAANCFSQVKICRLAEIVCLSEADCERFIMKMVNGKALTAKIDRIDGLVVFKKAQKASEDVEDWNKAVEKVSLLIDKAAHLVVKERMLQRIGAAQAQQAAQAAAALAQLQQDQD